METSYYVIPEINSFPQLGEGWDGGKKG